MDRGKRSGRHWPAAVRMTFLGLVCWLAAAAVPAQQGHRCSVSSPADAGQRSARSVPGTVHQRNRYLLPPVGLGSAANAPPGFYRQLDAPRRVPGRAPGARRAPVVVPYVVYVEPPAYAASPPRYEPPPPRDAAPAPAPPAPIYIVQPPPPAPEPPAPEPRRARPAPAPRSREPVVVSFSIRPADAAVYLDDERLGSGGELTARDTAMRLRPGVYVLEVVHPEHPPQRLVFGLSSPEPIEVIVDLTAESVSRRSRIR